MFKRLKLGVKKDGRYSEVVVSSGLTVHLNLALDRNGSDFINIPVRVRFLEGEMQTKTYHLFIKNN
jgi:hypothetical protein